MIKLVTILVCAVRFRQGKIMLLASLAAWVIFNVPIGFIHPPATSCLVYNQSGFFIETPKSISNRAKRSISDRDQPILLMDAPFNTPNLFNNGDGDIMEHTWTPLPWQQESFTTGTTKETPPMADVPWKQLMEMDEETMDIPLPADRYVRIRRQSPMKPTHEIGMSPYTLEFTVNYNAEKNNQWVSPTFSYTIFNLNNIRKVFFLFLLCVRAT